MSKRLGRHVWYELMTTDIKSALEFYQSVIGWNLESAPVGDSQNYNVWKVGDREIGGVMEMPIELKRSGAPAHWLGYVAVDDVPEASRRAEQAGGRVIVPPSDIANVGAFSVVGDPQGAAIALFKATDPVELPDATAPGCFSWNELATTDPAAAMKFYADACEWTPTQSHDIGPKGRYQMFGPADKTIGGMFKISDENTTPHWLYYILVADVEAVAERAKTMGGTVVSGPMPVPDGGMVAQIRDPQGVLFAVHSS